MRTYRSLHGKKLYITNNMERFSFKSGRSVRIAKLIKEDWPMMLQ